jgi:hypothetical protein
VSGTAAHGRDGFWLARWLRNRGIECHVIHPTSVAVSREGRRAKTDRLDTALLMRAFLGPAASADAATCGDGSSASWRTMAARRAGALPPFAAFWPRPLCGSARSSADDRGQQSRR